MLAKGDNWVVAFQASHDLLDAHSDDCSDRQVLGCVFVSLFGRKDLYGIHLAFHKQTQRHLRHGRNGFVKGSKEEEALRNSN